MNFMPVEAHRYVTYGNKFAKLRFLVKLQYTLCNFGVAMKALILFILLLTGCASVPSDPDFATALSKTVFIDAPASSGTGVVLNDHCVLTVAHVLAEDPIHQLIMADGTSYLVTKISMDEKEDIGVACVAETIKIAPVIIAKQMPLRYARVFKIGYPLHFHKVLTEGRYQLDSLITAPVAPGDSGGGVFSADGVLVGLVDNHAIYRNSKDMILGYPHLVGIVEVGPIKTFLDSQHIAYTSTP